ncbi:MAG TPA: aldehyde dehydrogenase family protein [Candidatus Binatia bacterium]|jgi:acyl-CoA reductase-like NAD-dependent aldehyde dehydrogenase|nr:aldehyde dehydrogenase family protein [Candidatus Binatia bacterium]
MTTAANAPETPARRYQLFINGKFVDAKSGKTFETIFPHDRSVQAVVAEGDKVDIEDAVVAARAAYDGGWGTMLPSERARLLLRMADLIEERAQELARLETLDVGMPAFLATGMVMSAADVFRYWAGWATKIHGFTSPSMQPGDYLGYTLREPLGVVGGITPWNGPLIMATWKTAPALACGNTVVLKPAEHTPMTAMELARIAADAGIPEGVFNVVPGFGPTAGAALAQHPDVNKIAFTGEYVTGRLVVQMSTSNLKTVTLELGGKSPHIIFDDVDLEAAVANALFGLYTNTGQICSAGTRLLVQESIHDRFLERFVERSKQIKVGNPLDFSTRMGPLVSEEQLRKVERYVQIGQREGARLLCGGGRPKDTELASGFYHEPTVFADVTNQMQIAQEEIFGPVGSVIRFSDEDDAVRIGNDVIYGLAAGVQTRDVKRAHRIAKRLQAGTVWINTWHKIEPNSPFGGYKLSGYGRENGPTMIDHLTRLKQVWVDLNEFTMDLFGM